MAPNQTYIEKADLAVNDLVTEGGYLNAEQASEFFEIAIEESVLLKMIKVKPMSGPSYELSKMGFTGRILRGATEGQGLPEGDRSRPDLGRVTLTTVEFIAEVRVPYGAVEDNVAQGTFIPYMMKLMGKAVSRDIEEISIQGDTASADPVLALMDGFLKQAVSQVVTVGQVRLTKSILKQMAQTMPTPFFRDRREMFFITSKNAAIDYADSLSSRATPLGDKMVVEHAAAEWGGIPVIDIPMFPEDQGAGTNETSVLLAQIKNLTVGIQRDIRIETDRDISAREFIIVATIRFDTKYAHEPAVVKATEVLATAGP
jgi:hypothetical protein